MSTEQFFDGIKPKRRLPLNETAENASYHELDERFPTEVLSITSADLHTVMSQFRQRLYAESSVHCDKKARCNLEAKARKLGGNLV